MFLQPEKLSSVLVHALDMEGDRIKAELMKKEVSPVIPMREATLPANLC